MKYCKCYQKLTYINWMETIRLEKLLSCCCIEHFIFSNNFLGFKTSVKCPRFTKIMELILWNMTDWAWLQTHKSLIEGHDTSGSQSKMNIYLCCVNSLFFIISRQHKHNQE